MNDFLGAFVGLYFGFFIGFIIRSWIDWKDYRPKCGNKKNEEE